MTPNLPVSGLLTSWKEIANFLGKGVRTVQRWEATLGLPVIRPAEGRSGIVMARTEELEAWVLKGRLSCSHDTDGWQQRNCEVRAAFSECVRDLHQYQHEVKSLCDQMQATHLTLQNEIDRLKLLYTEWAAIRSRVLNPAAFSIESKVN